MAKRSSKQFPEKKLHTYFHLVLSVFFQSTHHASFLPFSFQNEAAESGTGIIFYSKLAIKGVVQGIFLISNNQYCWGEERSKRTPVSETSTAGRARNKAAAPPVPGTGAAPPRGRQRATASEPPEPAWAQSRPLTAGALTPWSIQYYFSYYHTILDNNRFFFCKCF